MRDRGADRPAPDLALRHLGRQADRAGPHPFDRRHGPGRHAAARPALVGLRRRGLRPGGAQQRAQLLPDAAAARDRGAARPRRAADAEQLSAQRRGRLLPAARPGSGAVGEGRAVEPGARGASPPTAAPLELQVAALREALVGAPAAEPRARASRCSALPHAARGGRCGDRAAGRLRCRERRVPLRGRPEPPHAAALGQRDRQRVLRLPGVRIGHRLHLGRQQPACTRSRPGPTTRCRTRPSSTTCCRTWTRASCCRSRRPAAAARPPGTACATARATRCSNACTATWCWRPPSSPTATTA